MLGNTEDAKNAYQKAIDKLIVIKNDDGSRRKFSRKFRYEIDSMM